MGISEITDGGKLPPNANIMGTRVIQALKNAGNDGDNVKEGMFVQGQTG